MWWALFGLCLLQTAPVSAQIFSRFYDPWWNGNYRSSLMGVPMVSYRNTGGLYLNEEWLRGRITLKDGLLVAGYDLRYDLENRSLEIRLENKEVQRLEINHVASFEWYNPRIGKPSFFVSSMAYKEDGVPLVGIFEVLNLGAARVFVKIDSEFYRNNFRSGYYDMVIEEGFKKEEKFYLALGQDEVFPLSKSLKDNLHLFKGEEAEIRAFAKKEGLGCRKRKEVVQIVDYYNSLLQE